VARANTEGNSNSAFGSGSLQMNTTGSANSVFGNSALALNTTGNNNLSIGLMSGFQNSTGSGNIFLGYQAGYNETGSDKLYIDNSNTTTPLLYGDFSTNLLTINGDLAVADAEEYFIGSTQVLSKGNGSLTGNLIVGDGGGSLSHTAASEGYYNTAVGQSAPLANTTGYQNSVLGALALRSNTTGNSNTAIGEGAIFYNGSGDYNSALGMTFLYSNTSGTYNTGVGMNAGHYNQTGSYNTLIGVDAGRGVSSNSFSNNTFIGYQSGNSTTTGGDNFFGGYMSGRSNQTGVGNVYIGKDAGYSNQTGAGNIFLGYQAGYSESGSNKLYIDNSNTASPLIHGDFSTDVLTVNGGLVVGAPTGGAKGTGTINAVGVYDDNVLLNDYVFDYYYDGRVRDEDLALHGNYKMYSLDEMTEYVKTNRHLPSIPGREEWNTNGKFSLGKLTNHLWETSETNSLYITELNERLKSLDSRLGIVESQGEDTEENTNNTEENTDPDSSQLPIPNPELPQDQLSPDILNYIDQKISSLDIAEELQGDVILSLDVAKLTVTEDAIFIADITVKGHMNLGEDSIGQAEILPGATEVEIEFKESYLYQPVVTVTPRGESALTSEFRYTVIDESLDGFKIKIDEAQEKTIKFSWHAFGSEEGKIFISDKTHKDIEISLESEDESEEEDEPVTQEENPTEDPTNNPITTSSTEEVSTEETPDNSVLTSETPDIIQ